MGEGNLDAFEATPLPQVEVIERARANANQRFTRTRERLRNLFVAEDISSPVRVKANRFHDLSHPLPRLVVANKSSELNLHGDGLTEVQRAQ